MTSFGPAARSLAGAGRAAMNRLAMDIPGAPSRRHRPHSSISSNRPIPPANRKHAARLGNALFHSSGNARNRLVPFLCIRASRRLCVGVMAMLDHIVQRTTRRRPAARDARSRRFAPRSRAFRYRNERVARANAVDRSAIAPRTGSHRRHRCRVHLRRRARVRTRRCQN